MTTSIKWISSIKARYYIVNKPSAKEWLKHAYHDLHGSKLLYQAEHFTDTISYVVHQSIEKSLKSILAYNNKAIKKTHNLIDLYELVTIYDFILDDDYIFLLAIASKYHTEQRYPIMHKTPPSMEEISQMLELSQDIFTQVCSLLQIDSEELKK